MTVSTALDLARSKSELVRLVYFGVTRSPGDAWVAQQLREATPFGEGPRFLIRDNDTKFGAAFARVAEGSGIEVLTTPYQAPKANAVCERFLGSVRRECLDFFLILNDRHLHQALKQHQAYFNQARPHQGLDQRLPYPPELPEEQQDKGKIIALPVLGGLHHDYQRRALARSPLPRAARVSGEGFIPATGVVLHNRIQRKCFCQGVLVD